MDNFTWKEILLALVGVIASITGAVPLFKLIGDAVEKRSEKRRLADAAHQSSTTEAKKIDFDKNKHADDILLQVISEKNIEIDKLKEQAKEAELNPMLPKALRFQINLASKRLGTQVENVRFLFKSNAPKVEMEVELEILDQNYNDLDKLLP